MSKDEENPFGEVVFSYTLEQAVEDGVLVDFGALEPLSLRRRIVMTSGILAEVNARQLLQIFIRALNRIKGITDMIVFHPKGERVEAYEDKGRTFIATIDGLAKKCYAKKDGNVVTFMLAEEY